ncbi:recombinase family protein [Rhodovulum steppense]|uniref:recombinase family protein n=1 Tax=Rhodovulum steppense TaxID=540251 RepID=UPI003C780714
MNKHAPIRAALYARYSTDKQNPKSIDDQLYECRVRARREGWEVIDEYVDRAMSSAVNDRPGYVRLLEDIEKGKFEIVLSESMDRISRDNLDIAYLWKLVEHHGVEIHTLDQGKMDFIRVAFAGIVGTMFLKALAEKTRRGQAGKVRDGENPGGVAYGYRVPVGPDGLRIPGALEIVPEEAAIVRRILTEYAQGKSPLKIAAQLNEEGIPAPRPRKKQPVGHWRQNTLNGNVSRGTGILNNELYVGKRVWNRLRYSKDPKTRKRTSRLNAPDAWQVCDVPDLRIVDDALWDAVKARQRAHALARGLIDSTDRNGLSASQGLRRRTYLVSGLLECGCCGGKMTIAGSGKSKRYYCANAKEKGPAVCQGMPGLLQSVAETTIIVGLQHELMQPAAYERFRKQMARHLKTMGNTGDDERKHYLRLISVKETARENIMAAVRRGLVDDEAIAEANGLVEELKQLRAKLDTLAPKTIELPETLPQMWQDYVANLVSVLAREPIAGRAGDTLHQLVERVVVLPHPEKRRAHVLEIWGDIVAMFIAADPDRRAGYDASSCSLKLVAGVGFEPTTFRL